MGNLFDYVSWRGDLDFKNNSFNAIDGLIFASLSLIDIITYFVPNYPSNDEESFENVFHNLFKKYKREDINLGMIVPHDIVDLAYKCMDSKRFKDVLISNYINVIDEKKMMQFSAITFRIDNKIIISYCGTDDTLIGWQENLNLISALPIPAEIKATEYVEKVASIYPEDQIYLVGHSKGGNLATYAGIYANENIQDRIVAIYNYDGPGFLMEIDNDKFLKIKDRIYRTIPDFSIVGRLLNEYSGSVKIIKSTNHGIFQHDPFSWEIVQTDFINANPAKGALQIEKGILKLVDKLSNEQKKSLCDNLYQFILQTKKQTLTECASDKLVLLKQIKDLKLKNALIFTELILLIFKNGGI